jgi:N-acetylglucosamine kinase-like BadF-type ATPase
VSALLAVDGGQSGLRMALVEDGRPGPPAVVDGFSHGAGDRLAAIAAAVAAARRSLGVSAPVERACLGLTGAPATTELRARLGRLLSEALDGAAIWLGPDMVTAHAGALAGEPGVVVAVGTGAVVLGVGADGRAHRADGLGHLLGDDGSGFAIGQAAARAALRAREHRGPQTALEDAATAFFGGLDDLPHRLYSSSAPVRQLAAFAPEVARIARAGDDVARAIWENAVDRLVDTTAAVVARTFPGAPPRSVPVAHAGRLFGADDLLLAPFTARLVERCPAARHRAPLGDGLDGAARLVTSGLGPYAPLMHTTEGRTA